MFNKVLGALKTKKLFILNIVRLYNYVVVSQRVTTNYWLNTRFKYNFKYYITLILNKRSVFYFNFRSNVVCNLTQLQRRERYATQTHVMLNFLSYLLDFKSFNLFFFYKNVSFTHFIFLKDFFKVVSFSYLDMKIPSLDMFFNFGLSRSLSKYLKKVKTKKKFKKKMYYKDFLFNYKEVYL